MTIIGGRPTLGGSPVVGAYHSLRLLPVFRLETSRENASSPAGGEDPPGGARMSEELRDGMQGLGDTCRKRWSMRLQCVALLLTLDISSAWASDAKSVLEQLPMHRGICVILGDSDGTLAIELARESELMVYVQLQRADHVKKARAAADRAGFYGSRIYVAKGKLERIHLADNLADAVVVLDRAAKVPKAEVLRVLNPLGVALLGKSRITKPFPKGVEDWSHPLHGPDNNPVSNDRVARAPYLTQFLAEPYYAPMPQVTVASAGRAFKAFGNFAQKTREHALLNKLVAFNGYNGTVLWTRDLQEGFFIRRNTMIATPETLYLGDGTSCKLLDTATGRLKGEISPPKELTGGGTAWKWMGLENNVLCGVVGGKERRVGTRRLTKDEKMGWASRGRIEINYGPRGLQLPATSIFAMRPRNHTILWHHRETDPFDARATCMKNGRVFIVRWEGYLACLDTATGRELWRKTKGTSPDLFRLLEEKERRAFRTVGRYLIAGDRILCYVSSAGTLVVLSPDDGRILWTKGGIGEAQPPPYYVNQILIRDDALYAFGFKPLRGKRVDIPNANHLYRHPEIFWNKKLNPLTGEVVSDVAVGLTGNCVLLTGNVDSIFARHGGFRRGQRTSGTNIRYDIESNQLDTGSCLVRPNCISGVTSANGHLYWWPMVCDCNTMISGVLCKGTVGKFDYTQQAVEAERLERQVSPSDIEKFPVNPRDWPTFRADNTCSSRTTASVPEAVTRKWQFKPASASIPSAATTAGGLVFVSYQSGVVAALDVMTGDPKWTSYTGGSIRLPPTIWKGLALVGSGDGWVYAFEAATGQLVWRFRVAPQERMIPVFGSLLSTWPAASGVLVDKGTAYVAAGILGSDGTHIYALDAATGKIVWQNHQGPAFKPEELSVCVQGHLLVHDGKLYLAGGMETGVTSYSVADGRLLSTGRYLHESGWELALVNGEVKSRGKTLYSAPDTPFNSFTLGMQRKVGDDMSSYVFPLGGQEVVWSKDRHIRLKTRTGDVVWQHEYPGSAAVVVSGNAVVTTIGKPFLSKQSEGYKVVALDLRDGRLLWEQPLPAEPVRWGLAIDRNGRVIVSLRDGRVLCFAKRP